MNSNCLHGLRCPQCGSDEPFSIEVRTTVLVWDDGTDTPGGGHIEWDDLSRASCGCGWHGRVADMQTPPLPPRG